MTPVRRSCLLLVLLLTAAPVRAQGGSSRALLSRGRAAVAQGELARAYSLLRRAAERGRAAVPWREAAEVAEHLHLDEAAREAYRTYLERAPRARDRAEIEGRVRVLTAILGGHRFRVSDDGRVEPPPAGDGAEADDGDGEAPAPEAPGARGLLVDWDGHGTERRGRSPILELEPWDSSAPAAARAEAAAPQPGLGRALSPP